jgi:hypothetical protein
MLLDQVMEVEVHLNLVGTPQSVFVLLAKESSFAMMIRYCYTLFCNQTSDCINSLSFFQYYFLTP